MFQEAEHISKAFRGKWNETLERQTNAYFWLPLPLSIWPMNLIFKQLKTFSRSKCSSLFGYSFEYGEDVNAIHGTQPWIVMSFCSNGKINTNDDFIQYGSSNGNLPWCQSVCNVSLRYVDSNILHSMHLTFPSIRIDEVTSICDFQINICHETYANMKRRMWFVVETMTLANRYQYRFTV